MLESTIATLQASQEATAGLNGPKQLPTEPLTEIRGESVFFFLLGRGPVKILGLFSEQVWLKTRMLSSPSLS